MIKKSVANIKSGNAKGATIPTTGSGRTMDMHGVHESSNFVPRSVSPSASPVAFSQYKGKKQIKTTGGF